MLKDWMRGFVSLIWASVNHIRAKLYHYKWISQVQTPYRVISVGNLEAGGTGKTPLVIALSQAAIQDGKRVAILLRGYGGQLEKVGGVIAPGRESASPVLFGDEAVLMHEQTQGAWIAVGRDRVQSIKLLEQAGAKLDWVILDDGFQYHRLKKNCELVIDTNQKWGKRFFREFRIALKRADWVINGSMQYHYPTLHLSNGPHVLVTGIGNPERFEKSMTEFGFEIVKTIFFPDHYPYSTHEILSIIESAKERGYKVIITGKDWVKWKNWLQDARSDYQEMLIVAEPTLVLQESWRRVIWGN